MIHNFLRSMMLPIKAIDKAIPKSGKITELGCGEGVIASYLAKHPKRHITGIDLNVKRIRKSKNINLHFKVGDITTINYLPQDGFVISDVLHHLSLKDQKLLLAKLGKTLRKKGVLVIKEIDRSEFLRSKMSRFWDFIFYPNDKINYWNSEGLKSYLEKIGFEISIQRPCRFFPGSTTLFICKKNV